jgi:hypothetical protein
MNSKKLGACRSEICSDFLGYGATIAIAKRSEQISDLHAPNVGLWAKPALVNVRTVGRLYTAAGHPSRGQHYGARRLYTAALPFATF